MKLLLINPKCPSTLESGSESLRWYHADADMAPLELALLAAATPSGHTVTIVDQQAGDDVDFQAEVDLVVCVARAEQVPPLRYLAGRFRARKVPVALVGSWVTACAQLASRSPLKTEQNPLPGLVERTDMVDFRLIGPLETVWPAFLKEFSSGLSIKSPRQKIWTGPPLHSLADAPSPRWDSLRPHRYRLGVVEVARELPVVEEPEAREAFSVDEALPADLSAFQSSMYSVQYKGVARVLEELEAQIALGVRRFWLESPDLFAGPVQAGALLEALASLNARHQKTLQFETSLSLRSTGEEALLQQLALANVRKVLLVLNKSEPVRADSHAELHAASEAVRRVLERGIRVSARLTLGRSVDDEPTLSAQEALLRECGALPWPRVAKAQTGSPLHQRLKEAGRLLAGARDAELRHELLESPNFTLTFLDKDAFVGRLRVLLEQLYAPTAQELRLRALYEEAQGAPAGPMLPSRVELQALLTMLMGSLQHRDERRLEQTGRAIALTLALRPSPRLLTQALELHLEDAAARSFVHKTLAGLPLDQAMPALSWKQRAMGLGASLVGRFGPRQAASSPSESNA